MAKAVRYHKQGGPEVLQLDDVQVGDPGPGQVRIRHTAIGVNFVDTYQRSGLYPMQLPATAGNEAAGVVEAMWIDREDDRVRPAHHALHGFVFRYDEEPPLKASLASNGEACWPGDDYNCRCTARIVSAVRPAEVREETAGGGVDAA